MATSGREFLETWFRRVWTEEDASAIGELYASRKVEGLGPQTIVTPADFEAFQRALLALVCEVEVTIDRYLEDGEWIAALCTFNAKSRATGDPLHVTGSIVGRIKDGRLEEAYNHWDFLGLWGQLGCLPPDSFARGLRGEKIA